MASNNPRYVRTGVAAPLSQRRIWRTSQHTGIPAVAPAASRRRAMSSCVQSRPMRHRRKCSPQDIIHTPTQSS